WEGSGRESGMAVSTTAEASLRSSAQLFGAMHYRAAEAQHGGLPVERGVGRALENGGLAGVVQLVVDRVVPEDHAATAHASRRGEEAADRSLGLVGPEPAVGEERRVHHRERELPEVKRRVRGRVEEPEREARPAPEPLALGEPER